MEDGSSQRKRARMENGPESCCRLADQPFDLVSRWNSVKGSDYLRRVSDFVSMYRHRTLDLENPPGATLTIGDLEDTIYSEEDDEVNGWGKFYLPNIVNMQVIGVVEGTSCSSDQLVLMTCENKKLYAFDGDKLHLVASSLRQLHYKGIKYPAPKRYYEGEAFKHKTEDDWAKVEQRLDQEHHELVMSVKSEILDNLRLLKQNIESQGICMSLDCGRKPKNPYTEHTTSIEMGPKPGSNPVLPYCGEILPTHPCQPFIQMQQLEGHQVPEVRLNRLAIIQFQRPWSQKRQEASWAKKKKTGKLGKALCRPAGTTTKLHLGCPSHCHKSHFIRARGIKHSAGQRHDTLKTSTP